MKARQIVEMLTEGAPAPAAPKPKTRPEAPSKPAAPAAPKPKRFDNPWRRRHLRPGEEPAPKARMEAQEAEAGGSGNWSEERIRAALQNPRSRQKAEYAVGRPDDGTPEWEDEVVQAVLRARTARSKPAASEQPSFSGSPSLAARMHTTPQWTDERLRASLQNPRVRRKVEFIGGRPDDGTPEWEDEALQILRRAVEITRRRSQTESIRARNLFR